MKWKAMILVNLVLLAASVHAAEMQADKVVATVNGASITRAQVNAEVNRLMPQSFFHQNMDEQKTASLRKGALNNLIEKELKIQEAVRLGGKVSEKEVQAELDKVIASYPSREAFEGQLKAGGFTLEQAKAELRNRKLAEWAYRTQVTDKVNVSESDAGDYYQKNRAKFVEPSQIHLKNILLKVPPLANGFELKTIEENAKAVVQKIKQGISFEEAVQKYSEGPDKEKGGDMGWVHKGRMAPEIEKEILVLKPREIAGPFKTFRGYYIFRVEEIRPERHVPFEEIKDKLISDLKAKAVEEKTKAWMDGLKQKSKIVVMDPSFSTDVPPAEDRNKPAS